MHIPRILLVCLLAACGPAPAPNVALAAAIAHGLAAACPIGGDPASETARDTCADRLTELGVLRDAMVEPFIWGGQKVGAGYALDRGTNKFNARVWRRLYLSTFMFDVNFAVEQVSDRTTILHVPVTFRGAMPPGAYPYPFWHSAKKWDAYSHATTIHFVIRGGAVVGALRGAEQDPARPVAPHTWDGAWRWQDGAEPHVALYDYLLSTGNPFAPVLDRAYRELELGLRKHNCQTCHAPDNRGKSEQLEFFVYPAQALAGRHDIITQISDDLMPPANDLGIAPGIASAAECADLLSLAIAFAAAGDSALAWDGDFKPLP